MKRRLSARWAWVGWAAALLLLLAGHRLGAQPGLAGPTAAVALPEPVPPAAGRPGPTAVPLTVLAILAAAVPALLWGGLALGRAHGTDRWRARRTAARKLGRLLRTAPAGRPARPFLERWRTLSADAWGLALAVPTPGEIGGAVGGGATGAAWARLWLETEYALFARELALPEDWLDRARGQLDSLPSLPRGGWIPCAAIHWWPRPTVALGLLGASLGALSPAGRAAEALGEFQAGRLPAAQALWLAQLAGSPGDWADHHNVALTYAAAGRWGPAAGHWTTAFLLNPRDPAVARGFALGIARLETAEPRLQRLASPRGWGRLATQASIAQWQRVAAFAFVLLGLGLVLLVLSLYLPLGRRPRQAAAAAALGAALLAAAALTALRQYGPLVRPTAAFVVRPAELRAIPSDLVTREDTATLQAGTIVSVNRSFFGWDQVSVGAEAAGWVRTDALLWLYRRRDNAAAVTIQSP